MEQIKIAMSAWERRYGILLHNFVQDRAHPEPKKPFIIGYIWIQIRIGIGFKFKGFIIGIRSYLCD